eukprot:gnl/TRDRNA2_/TRDRNA2_133605_c0_seq1.p1 gnl/TRDRNA2_/TRDRNA2_133605_c0~~gnl/TRDRNA2_/TRDRNA2_133605_c0_seq1.p1  ORF type:complete len:214 (+),score=46.95 gnl/TRDRNA2_/TRDRNA2_133605_c0_seq1:28-669(+)
MGAATSTGTGSSSTVCGVCERALEEEAAVEMEPKLLECRSSSSTPPPPTSPPRGCHLREGNIGFSGGDAGFTPRGSISMGEASLRPHLPMSPRLRHDFDDTPPPPLSPLPRLSSGVLNRVPVRRRHNSPYKGGVLSLFTPSPPRSEEAEPVSTELRDRCDDEDEEMQVQLAIRKSLQEFNPHMADAAYLKATKTLEPEHLLRGVATPLRSGRF